MTLDHIDYDGWESDGADEPVDSCTECGMNIYADEDDGSGYCDQCQWLIEEANRG